MGYDRTGADRGAALLWILLLTATSAIVSLVLKCATPFPALAALAAVHMGRRDGLALMALVWAASQAVGFCLQGFPHEAATYGWAASLLFGGIASVIAADGFARRAGGDRAGLALGYVAGFVAFKLVVLFFGMGIEGHIGAAFSGSVLVTQFVRNAAILIGLAALYHGLVALGAPLAGRRALA
ncbi:hypothetical protein [Sphingomonas quercus]|uniref:Uncharacterized protein n=1 Tax=Sphingomonas quercus TaxID=2842451 RepID=A0ABS6BK66_9SPHN|nr:hypothetical protein [Sphingomonas quercus]MBU3078691.1 hypothetical protein [Sphingomonas quercus]